MTSGFADHANVLSKEGTNYGIVRRVANHMSFVNLFWLIVTFAKDTFELKLLIHWVENGLCSGGGTHAE